MPLNPFLQAILGPGPIPGAAPGGPPPPAADPGLSTRESPYTGLATPYLDLPDRTPAEQAGWQKWWDTKDDTAYSGAGGYHPRPDIVEMRGGYPNLTSAYGVGVPSNATLGRKFAVREQVGIQKQEADARLATAEAHRLAAEEAAKQGEYNRSAEAYRRHLIDEGAGRGVPEAAAKAAEAGGFQTPAETLAKQGVAKSAEKVPRNPGEAILQYEAGGGAAPAAGSPERAAWERQYGTEALRGLLPPAPSGNLLMDFLTRRAQRWNTSWTDWLAGPRNSSLNWLLGRTPQHERVAAATARLFPDLAEAAQGQVGVPGPVAANPGVAPR